MKTISLCADRARGKQTNAGERKAQRRLTRSLVGFEMGSSQNSQGHTVRENVSPDREQMQMPVFKFPRGILIFCMRCVLIMYAYANRSIKLNERSAGKERTIFSENE